MLTIGTLEYWNDGIMSYGKLDSGFVGEFFLTSTLQYSTIPLLHELGEINN